jgi:hypothetical protein
VSGGGGGGVLGGGGEKEGLGSERGNVRRGRYFSLVNVPAPIQQTQPSSDLDERTRTVGALTRQPSLSRRLKRKTRKKKGARDFAAPLP